MLPVILGGVGVVVAILVNVPVVLPRVVADVRLRVPHCLRGAALLLLASAVLVVAAVLDLLD
eukprot:12194032-Alexandrium_andersonii.AAC.1